MVAYQFRSSNWYLQPAMAFLDAVGSVLFFKRPKQFEIKSILIIQMGNFGDLMVTLPTIEGFRQTFPNANVDVLMKASMSPALPLEKVRFSTAATKYDWMPASGKLASKEFSEFMKSDLFRVLKARQYDLIVDVHGDPRNIWLAWKLGGKLRVGFDVRGLGFFLTHKANFDPDAHIIDRYFETVKCFNKDAPIPDVDLGYTWIPDKHNEVCIHPGTGLKIKEWTVKGWARVADLFLQEGRLVKFTYGRTEELDIIHEIKEYMEYATQSRTVKTTTFHELTDTLCRCDLFLSPDTGPAHLAHILGTPHLTLFGPSMAKRWGYEGSYLEQPCECVNELECKYGSENRCMSKLDPDIVYNEARVKMHDAGTI